MLWECWGLQKVLEILCIRFCQESFSLSDSDIVSIKTSRKMGLNQVTTQCVYFITLYFIKHVFPVLECFLCFS